MEKKLPVAFLWHLHQPLYKDFVTGKYYLPWVRLHATYSYLDMVSILEDFPRVKVTFNLTPSLIWQLLDLSGEVPVDDIYLQLSEKDAADLTDEDKCFLLKNFFSCDLERAISPFKKYRKLFSMRGDDLSEKRLMRKSREFSVPDLRDLQVFFNLAWCGFTLKEKDPLVRELARKGGGYTEDEKLSLLKRQKEVVASIIPTYKRLQDEGRIEISTSPYYHPILPLLCRGKSQEGFDFCEDAKAQVKKAVVLYEEVFGKKPAGMWPSEGSVSQEIIPMLADEGIKWIATDEGILYESFKGKAVPREELIYRAYTASQDGRSIDMVFRDINISNAVSFRYSGLPGKDAAADLFKDIAGIRKTTRSSGGEHVVAVILDGENPWPYYREGGKEFLSEIYRRMSSGKDIEPVTIGGYLASHKKRKIIKRLASGSWINRSFRKWIGLPQKNLAWNYLARARKKLFSSGRPCADALEELYIAEGSDWFWWYDEFGTELNFVFDDLFRMHLANAFRLEGRKVPDYLRRPIPSVVFEKGLEEVMPAHVMAVYPKVLIVSPEVFPFAKTGGLADVTGSLSKALVSLGCEVRAIMPFYKCVAEGGFEMEKEASHIKRPLPGGLFGFDLHSNRTGGVTTYFVDKKRFFARDGLYGTASGDFRDNAFRFGFFSAAVLDAVKTLDFKPDVIHCNDWQTALVPFYLRFRLSGDDFYDGIKTLFTIHNMAYQGIFGRNVMHAIGVPESFFNMHDLEFHGKLNFMKSGILYSDAVSTVSRRYAEEVMTAEYGCGLEEVLRLRRKAFYGILNGVDYSVWSPESDRFIASNYDAAAMEKKLECKKDLLEYTGLPLSPEAPLLGCVTRLAEQKGMDLLAGIMGEVVKLGAGVVILGWGDEHYNRLFSALEAKYPRNLHVHTGFNEELAHKIEAGCDIFVMPSRYEPCGLNQMYSVKYGTIPVVRATGGLDDVIVDFDKDSEKGNGFKFGPATGEALYGAIKRAVTIFEDKPSWKKLMANAMACDFSWTHAAEQYLKLYRKLMAG